MRPLQIVAGLLITLNLFVFSGFSGDMNSAQAQDGELKTYRFKQNDVRRRFKLYSPVNAENLSGYRPLVLVIHGGGSTDRGMLKLTKSRWHELADKFGFYVAYPNAAFERTWDFDEGIISGELEKRVDDLAYFERVIDQISSQKTIDQDRVFATGISRGGQASYFLACNLSSRIRAVAPVAMGLPLFMADECEDAPPVGMALINGTGDPQVPFEGGEITVFSQKRGHVMGAEKTIKLWLDKNGCRQAAAQTQILDQPGDETSVNITEWTQCRDAPVKFYKVINGGHTWPGGLQYLGARIVGHTSYDIDASDEAWDFFSRFE